MTPEMRTKLLTIASVSLGAICISLIVALSVVTPSRALNEFKEPSSTTEVPSTTTGWNEEEVLNPLQDRVTQDEDSTTSSVLHTSPIQKQKPTDYNHEEGKEEEEEEEEELPTSWEKEIRLPASVLPIHYDLYLHPDLNSGLFNGRVGVHITSLEDGRDHFLLHTKYLKINKAKMYKDHIQVPLPDESGDLSSYEVDLLSTFEYDKHEFFVFKTMDPVQDGNYTLYLEFNGNLTRGLVGFYKSVYKNGAGRMVPIATSKFQPTYARQAFPCFDEPSFKSTFSVSLVRPSESYIALSNMPQENEIQDHPSPGLTLIQFQKSVPMVTYLACFIVCDFEYEEKITEVHGTLLRVYAQPNQKHRISYALELGANVSDFYVDYFQIPYPLPKQDMIAIPDFVSGAMEHWGLITYRETLLLYDEEESSSKNHQNVAKVVSHELAHQWFGNLVTLAWWDDLWLNEGFASFIEYKGMNHYHPDWKVHDQFITLDLHSVMDLDSQITSHPIIQDVKNPSQITEIFDKISYDKGSSILRMLENFMGEEEFRIGVSRFLEKYKFDNAVTEDLWRELEKISSQNLPIGRIMRTWTKQMGYPLITISRIKDNMYRCSQSRFLTNPASESQSPSSPYNYTWEIPLTWVNENKEIQRVWLTPDQEYIDISIPSNLRWLKFNEGQYGYYRVNYPLKEWMEFSSILQNNKDALSVKDRANLINDAFSLAEAGLLKYSFALSLLKYLPKELEYVPWSTAYESLYDVGELLRETTAYAGFRKFILSLVREHYVRLGWLDEGSHIEKLHRINVLSIACRFGDDDCIEEARKQFERWILEKNIYITPNLRSLVYKYGMYSDGSFESWKVLMERYQNEINAQEKNKLLFGLAWPRDPWILNSFIQLAKNDSVIRSQDYFNALRHINSNPIGRPLVWNYIRQNWSDIVNRFGLQDRYLGKLVKSVISKFTTPLQLEEVRLFFAKYPEGGAGSRAREQGIEKIENNIKWLSQHQKEIESWLSSDGYS